MFVSILVGFFAAWECVPKSLVNAFPRNDLVRGKVVTHLICDSAQTGLTSHLLLAQSLIYICLISSLPLTPPISPASLCLNPPSLSFYFNDCRFTRWLEKSRAAKKCANTWQCSREKQKKARTSQKAPTAFHCILTHAFMCSSLHVITRPLAGI